jgi:hypothetical protein
VWPERLLQLGAQLGRLVFGLVEQLQRALRAVAVVALGGAKLAHDEAQVALRYLVLLDLDRLYREAKRVR